MANIANSTNIITPEMHKGELRILDTDLAARLGFSQARDIRKLIKRYLPELDRMGVRATVAQTSSEHGGRPGTAYYLNRKQAIFITAKSETAEATDITIEIIHRFDAYERGEIAQTSPKPKRPRKPAIDITFRRLLNIAKLLPHVDENQQVLMAARGTFKMTGTNPLEVLDAPSLPAPNNDQYFTPTELGSKIGKSGVKMNIALADHGLQKREGKSWVMTEYGRHYGRMFDTTRRNGNGSQQQLKWKASVLDLIA